MDPTSYRIPIKPHEHPTATATHVPSSEGSAGRKRKTLPSTLGCEFKAQHTQPLEKKARRLGWTNDSKTALLQCRLHLSRIFENNNETNVKRAWEKIASMLDMPCTGDDCVQMFDFLVKKYLMKQQINFKGVKFESPEWQQYQTLEKLFLSSPRLAEFYESVELPSCEDQELSSGDESEDESSGIMKQLLLEFSKTNAYFTKYCEHVRNCRRRQRLLENKLKKIVEDILNIRRENMLLVSEFLKRILYNFNELDELAKRESFEALTSVFPTLFCMSSVAITIVSHFLQSTAFQNEQIQANTLFLIGHLHLISRLVDTPDEEDAFYVRLLPYSEQYFSVTKRNHPPEPITNQSALSNFDFKCHLNVTRSTIEELISRIGPVKARRPNPLRTLISIERQMVLFMWYLTHNETNEQLALRFSVLSTEVLVVLRHLIVLISEDLNLVCWPQKYSAKDEVIRAFESMRTHSFPGVIGALGTTYLSMKGPAWFYNSQGKICRQKEIQQHIAVQAIVDANLIFNSLHIAWLEVPGSKPEDLKPSPTEETKKVTRLEAENVFCKSPFYATYCRRSGEGPIIGKCFLPENIHVVADSSYPLMESVMVPYNKTQEEAPSQYLFDQQLHKSRQVIELALGTLMNRFQRLSCLDHSLLYTEGLVKTCMGIHNFCVKKGDDFDAKKIKLPEIEFGHPASAHKAAIAKRDKICKELSQGKISYVYRNPVSLEPTIVEDSLDINTAVENA